MTKIIYWCKYKFDVDIIDLAQDIKQIYLFLFYAFETEEIKIINKGIYTYLLSSLNYKI